MSNIKFTNFAHSRLAVGLGLGVTTLSVTGGQGSRFPALSAGEYFYLTIEDANLNREIVKVTDRSGDTMTIVRAQDNTTNQAWTAGDVVALRFNAAAIEDTLGVAVVKTGVTASAAVPAGTTAQRDAGPFAGYFRFNTTTTKFEGYNGTGWGSVGGGATGGGSDEVFIENNQNVTVNYTIPGTRNAMSTGPLTVNDGVTVTVSDGARWVIL
jgi:hypothetical protein